MFHKTVTTSINISITTTTTTVITATNITNNQVTVMGNLATSLLPEKRVTKHTNQHLLSEEAQAHNHKTKNQTLHITAITAIIVTIAITVTTVTTHITL